ncbi:MAG: hypothetical protein OHK0022_61230 [Roseiflexaceae bacterium]
MADTSSDLTPEQRALLILRLSKQRKAQTAQGQRPPLVPVPRNGPLPLSYAQQGMWFTQQFDPASPVYNVADAVELIGQFDRQAFQRALNEVIRRHEVLRTTFVPDAGSQPVQVIRAELRIDLPLVDLSELSAEQHETQLQQHMREEGQRPFDLQQGPLIRATLVRLAPEHHVLLFALHHLVVDGWSMGVLLREVTALYGAFSQGRPSPLADLVLQYADYAVWQRMWLQGDVLADQLAYWRRQLQDAPPTHDLSISQRRPERISFVGRTEVFTMPAEQLAALKQFSQDANATLFMTLLAAFKLLLHFYSNRDDIVVGTDVANRRQSELEPLIGLFVNQLVLRTSLSGEPSFRQVVERVRDVTVAAFTHQDLPFDKLVSALKPERGSTQMPFFQIKFVLQNAPRPPLELPGLQLNLIGVYNNTAKLDMLINLFDTPDGLMGEVQYHQDVFDPLRINHFIQNYQLILCHILAHPDVTKHDLRQLLETAHKDQQEAWMRANKQSNSKKLQSILKTRSS